MTTYLASLQEGLARAFAADPRVYLLGEDILDPYGGAFKVSKGLSTAFPGRVITTPISEAGIVAVGTGMALRGMRPVIEIMFGDFLTLVADQIVNHAVKFRGMYADRVRVPLVVRTPVGGGRGYGATHSQSLEKMFLGVPGLTIVAPSHLHDPGTLLEHAILGDGDPTLFLEHKLLYPAALLATSPSLRISRVEEIPGYPSAVAENYDSGNPDVTILSYGGMSREIMPLMESLRGEEIRVLAVFPATLQPVPSKTLIDCAKRCERVLIVEEGTAGFDWGAELATRIYEAHGAKLAKPVRRLAAHPGVIPTATHLESRVLPGRGSIESALLELMS